MLRKLPACIFLLIFVFIFAFFFQFTYPAFADTGEQRVYDKAGLLGAQEIETLEALSREIGQRYNASIYMLTDKSSNGLSRKRYIEDFADQMEVTNSTIIFVNMEEGDRGVEIQGYGTNEFYMNDSRIEHVLDKIVPYLSAGEYYTALTTFLEQTETYLGRNPKEDSLLANSWFQLAVSLAVGGIVVAIMAVHSGGKVTVNERTYLDSSRSKVIARHDDFVRTATTRVRRPQSNSGGRGGGGVSMGGRSHSGGGRSF